MSHTCTCKQAGYCDKFDREQSEEDFQVCQNCFNNPQRATVVGSWYRSALRKKGRMAGCAWKGPAILDEFGNHKFRRTCGCGGQASQIYLFECNHPQPRQAEGNCERRCTDYLSL